MTNKGSEILRELARVLVRSLGIIEKNDLSCCGITLAQCHAIDEIGRAEVISLIDLANLLGLDKSTVSRTIDNLVKAKMVIRELDPENRRYVNIRLASKGIDFFKKTEEEMNVFYSEILESIPEEKREQVMESLQLFSEVLVNKKCCQK